MIKAVIFDIDNTLYSYDKAHAVAFERLLAYVEEKLGITRDEFFLLQKEMNQELKAYMGDVAAVHNRLIRFQNILEKKGLPLYPHVLEMNELYWDTLLDSMTVSDGAKEALESLKKQGIRVGIGTDMTARLQFCKLTRLGLLPYVDFLVSSEEVGAEKPSQAFFDRCVEKAGCNAQECLFVGDSLKKDVRGAQSAGLKAMWYCPEGQKDMREILKEHCCI